MSARHEPPFIVVFIGALFGFHFPGIAFAIFALLALLKLFSAIVSTRQRLYNTWVDVDSEAASWYYRNRARVLTRLGLIGR